MEQGLASNCQLRSLPGYRRQEAYRALAGLRGLQTSMLNATLKAAGGSEVARAPSATNPAVLWLGHWLCRRILCVSLAALGQWYGNPKREITVEPPVVFEENEIPRRALISVLTGSLAP
jgi:hypothetical protein